MKEKSANGHPVLFSIIAGIILTVVIAASFAVSAILKFDSVETRMTQIGALSAMAVILLVYMTSNGRTLAMFGFYRFEILKSREVLYYIPLVIFACVQPVIGGMNTKLSLTEVIGILSLTMLVGFTEESVFRGIIKEKLKSKGNYFYIIFTSLFFGILHIANVLNGNITDVILQVLNAFFVGLILCELITVIENIIPLIAFHFMYDALAMMTKINDKTTLILAVLDGLYLIYIIYLLFLVKKKNITLIPAAVSVAPVNIRDGIPPDLRN